MTITIPYILSQIFAALWFTFLILTYFTKSITKIRVFTVVSAFCLIMSFLFLSAFTGVWAILLVLTISLVMFLPYFENNKNITILHIVLTVFSWLTMITITYLTYEGWPSLLPSIATLLTTYSLIQKNPLVYKILQAPQCFLFFTYHWTFASYIGVAAQFALMIILFFGIKNDFKRKIP